MDAEYSKKLRASYELRDIADDAYRRSKFWKETANALIDQWKRVRYELAEEYAELQNASQSQQVSG